MMLGCLERQVDVGGTVGTFQELGKISRMDLVDLKSNVQRALNQRAEVMECFEQVEVEISIDIIYDRMCLFAEFGITPTLGWICVVFHGPSICSLEEGAATG